MKDDELMSEYELSGSGDVDYGNPLTPEESVGEDEFGEDISDGYSPAERPWGVSAWGVTSYEESGHESLARRLAREQREPTDEPEGDGIGDSIGTDGELIDDQVGDRRAGRLVLGDVDELDPRSDYRATDAGIDGAGASAEEAAVHVVSDDLDAGTDGPGPFPVVSSRRPSAHASAPADET
jgi:Family of unknown function (DUF5709)